MQHYNNWYTVDVKYVGICGSDINRQRTNKINVNNVFYYGHEIVGEYFEHEKMIPCVVNPIICNCKMPINKKECSQKSCAYCQHIKKLGGGDVLSGFSGHISVPRSSIFPLTSVKNIEVGILTDGIAVVYHALHMYPPKPDDNILIIGSGCIGVLYAIVIARTFPITHIDLYVKNSDKIPYLKSILPKNANVVIKKQISPDTYDLVVEAVGGKQTESLSVAVDCVKFNGKILVLGAFNEETDYLKCIRNMFYKQARIQGVNSFCIKHNDFSNAVQFVCNNEVVLLPLLTNKFCMNNNVLATEVVNAIKAPKLLKGYIQYE